MLRSFLRLQLRREGVLHPQTVHSMGLVEALTPRSGQGGRFWLGAVQVCINSAGPGPSVSDLRKESLSDLVQT